MPWLSHKRLVDNLIEAYVDWREACRLVRSAYRDWGITRRQGAADAFLEYSKALDREERAAEEYARLVRRVGQVDAPPQIFAGHSSEPSRKGGAG